MTRVRRVPVGLPMRFGPGAKHKAPLPPKPPKGKGEPGSMKRRRRGAAAGMASCVSCGFPLRARHGWLYCLTGCARIA